MKRGGFLLEDVLSMAGCYWDKVSDDRKGTREKADMVKDSKRKGSDFNISTTWS